MKKADYITVLVKAGFTKFELKEHNLSELKSILKDVKAAENLGQSMADMTKDIIETELAKPQVEDSKSISLMKELLKDGYSLKLCAVKRYLTISGSLGSALSWIEEHKPHQVVAMKCGVPARHFNV